MNSQMVRVNTAHRFKVCRFLEKKKYETKKKNNYIEVICVFSKASKTHVSKLIEIRY